VGYEFLGTGNACAAEFVLLHGGVNGLKKGIWGEAPARNAFTLQDHAGFGNNLFQYVKNSMSVVKYYAEPAIQALLVAQKTRVGNRMDLLENTYVNNINKDVSGTIRTWGPLNLRADWNTFMRTVTAQTITKTFANVETYLTGMEEGYATALHRQAAVGQTQDAIDRREFIAKIDALRAEWTNNRPTWTNPFP
jgi:chitinase